MSLDRKSLGGFEPHTQRYCKPWPRPLDKPFFFISKLIKIKNERTRVCFLCFLIKQRFGTGQDKREKSFFCLSCLFLHLRYLMFRVVEWHKKIIFVFNIFYISHFSFFLRKNKWVKWEKINEKKERFFNFYLCGSHQRIEPWPPWPQQGTLPLS